MRAGDEIVVVPVRATRRCWWRWKRKERACKSRRGADQISRFAQGTKESKKGVDGEKIDREDLLGTSLISAVWRRSYGGNVGRCVRGWWRGKRSPEGDQEACAMGCAALNMPWSRRGSASREKGGNKAGK